MEDEFYVMRMQNEAENHSFALIFWSLKAFCLSKGSNEGDGKREKVTDVSFNDIQHQKVDGEEEANPQFTMTPFDFENFKRGFLRQTLFTLTTMWTLRETTTMTPRHNRILHHSAVLSS